MRSLANKPNVDPADSDYPFGRIRDKGIASGTPVNEEVYGDFHQFFEKLMDAAGLTPNELPDNDYSGFQLFDAIIKLTNRRLLSSTKRTPCSGSSETTFTTHVIPAGTLKFDGQSLKFFIEGTAINNGNNKTIRLKFGATTIMGTGSLSSHTIWMVKGEVIRVSETQAKIFYEIVYGVGNTSKSYFINIPFYMSETAFSLNFNNDITVTLTGQGTATGECTGEIFTIDLHGSTTFEG